MYDTKRGVKELIDLNQFMEEDHRTGIDIPFFYFESILATTNNFSEENKLGKERFGPVYLVLTFHLLFNVMLLELLFFLKYSSLTHQDEDIMKKHKKSLIINGSNT